MEKFDLVWFNLNILVMDVLVFRIGIWNNVIGWIMLFGNSLVLVYFVRRKFF